MQIEECNESFKDERNRPFKGSFWILVGGFLAQFYHF